MEFVNFDSMKDNFGIYIIVNELDNSSYVGQTRQPFKKRYWHHLWKLKNGTHDNRYLQNAFNLYGEDNFKFKILEVTDDIDTLNELEVKYITYYRTNTNCYNLQSGGQTVSNYERTLEIRNSIGEKNRINNLGKKHSEETKRKMSKARTGKYYNEEHYTIDVATAIIIKNKLILGEKPSDIAKELNITYKVVNGILSTNSWKRAEVDGWNDFYNNRKKSRRISKDEQYEIYKLIISNKYTKKELAEKFNTSVGTIGNIFKRFNN